MQKSRSAIANLLFYCSKPRRAVCRINFYLHKQVGILSRALYVPWPINGGRIRHTGSRIPY